MIPVSAHARDSNTVLNIGHHTADSGIQVLDSSLCQWNLDSGFQAFKCDSEFLFELQIKTSGFNKQTFPVFWVLNALTPDQIKDGA